MENGLKAGNGEKMENQMENRPELDRGKNGPKMTKKWRKYSKIHSWGPFFAPVKLGAVFHLVSIFSPFSAFRPFSIPCRPDRIPKVVGEFASEKLHATIAFDRFRRGTRHRNGRGEREYGGEGRAKGRESEKEGT